MNKEERFLPVKLEPHEIAERSSELAAMNVSMRELGERKKSVTSALKADEELLKNKIDKLASAVHTGKESRQVVCERFRDFALKVEIVIRCDTGETVESRPLTMGELQGEFSFPRSPMEISEELLPVSSAAPEPEPIKEQPKREDECPVDSGEVDESIYDDEPAEDEPIALSTGGLDPFDFETPISSADLSDVKPKKGKGKKGKK